MSDQARPELPLEARVTLWLVVAAYLALLVPSLLVDTPPLLDYANHNARLWMIAGGAKLAPLNQIYAVDWSRSSTTIGIDLIAAALGPVIGKDHVGQVCAALSILLPPLGAMLLHRRVFGGTHPWQLAITIPAFGKTALCGFMNFNIGLGVAWLGGAIDARLAKAGPIPAFLGRMAITVLTLVVHPFAAMAYGGVLLGLSLGRDWAPMLRWDGIRARILPGLIVVAPTLAAVALVFLVTPHPPGHVGQGQTAISWEPFTPRNVVAMLLTAFHSYVDVYDVLVLLILAGIVAGAAMTKRLKVHAGLLLAGLAFTAVALVMPTRIGDAYWLEFRLPTMAAFVLLAAVLPDFAGAGVRMLVTAGLFLLALSRIAVVSAAWVSEQADIRAVREAIASVPAGSSLLPLRREASAAERKHAPLGRYFGGVATWLSYAEHAIPQQRVFVPLLFAITGQQPLAVQGRYAPISQPLGGSPPRISELDVSPQPARHSYLANWRRDFDYILLLDADATDKAGGELSPADVELVTDKGFAALYRIKHSAP